jgi:uncharacterized protein with ATP-grasp and redox domains
MRVTMDCVSCMMRQTVDAARRAKADEGAQKRILIGACEILARGFNNDEMTVTISRDLTQLVVEETSVEDPYLEVKERHIKEALALYPRLKERVAKAPDRLLAALKTAAAGNVLDIFIDVDVQAEDVEEILNQDFALSCLEEFRQQLDRSKDVLILADNAGETVFDRILIEELGDKNVIYAVKDSPIANDATLKDARDSGLEEVATLISAGCSTAGTFLDDCTEEFRRLFFEADLVISKGMGNYEAISESPRPVFFLLKAKCQPVADDIGVPLGELIFARQEDIRK